MALDSRDWARDWDGGDEAWLANLAVRAYVKEFSGGDFAVDDAPGYEDGVADVKWSCARKSVGPKTMAAFKRGDGKVRISPECVAFLDDGMAHCSLVRRFEGSAFLKSLTDEGIKRIARDDYNQMEAATRAVLT